MRGRVIAGTAVLASLAAACELLPLDLPFPLFPKLTLDPTGIPLVLALLLYGPESGFTATIIASATIALPRLGKPPNPYGAVFKGLAELATLLGAYLSLNLKWGSELALMLLLASLSRIAVMSAANLLLLPLFYGLDPAVVVKLLPVIAVFNLTQALVNVLVAYRVFRAVASRLSIEAYRGG